MTNSLTHHEFTAEWVDDSHGRAIMLTQPADNYDEPGTVLVHPWQLRAVCEQFGITASDPQAANAIATLTRRMLLLNERIQHLDHWLRTYSDTKHADLTYELGFSGGTSDMAAEFCAELTDASAVPATPSPLTPKEEKSAPASAEQQPSLI